MRPRPTRRRVGRMPYREPRSTAISAPRSTGRCRGTRSRCRPGSPDVACSRAPASRPPPPAIFSRALASRLRVDLDLADEPGFEEMEGDRIRQPSGHGLVAHRVDLELERVAGALPGLGRVAHVGRLVVGDRHPLRTEHPERRRDDVGALARVASRPRTGRSPASIGSTSTRSQRPRTRSPPSVKLNSRST